MSTASHILMREPRVRRCGASAVPSSPFKKSGGHALGSYTIKPAAALLVEYLTGKPSFIVGRRTVYTLTKWLPTFLCPLFSLAECVACAEQGFGLTIRRMHVCGQYGYTRMNRLRSRYSLYVASRIICPLTRVSLMSQFCFCWGALDESFRRTWLGDRGGWLGTKEFDLDKTHREGESCVGCMTPLNNTIILHRDVIRLAVSRRIITGKKLVVCNLRTAESNELKFSRLICIVMEKILSRVRIHGPASLRIK